MKLGGKLKGEMLGQITGRGFGKLFSLEVMENGRQRVLYGLSV